MIPLPTRYPHILPVDVPVLVRWLTRHQDEFLELDFDVRVGDGRPAPPGSTREIAKMALDLSKRRIDVVAYFKTHIAVVEITRFAGLKAIGQLMAYPTLYRQAFSPGLEVRPLLVCEQLDTDIKPVLQDNHLDFELV